MQHVRLLGDLLEVGRANNTDARILFIHRDGRDVAISLRARGSTFEGGLDRWVNDNQFAMPYLDQGQIFPVSFEKLMNRSTVLETLRSVAEYLELNITEAELSLALLPGTREVPYRYHCTVYKNDQEKLEDLSQSFLNLLQLQSCQGGRVQVTQGGDDSQHRSCLELEERMNLDGEADPSDHSGYRTWQMTQLWTEVPWPPASRNWTKEEESYFLGREDAMKLMKRFGYLS